MSVIKEGIFIYLDKKATGILKAAAIKDIKKKFKLTEEKATQYYEEWRKNFMK